MKTYRFNKINNRLRLKSKTYTVYVSKKNGHLHVEVRGPSLKRQGLTNITSNITYFEEKVVALHFYKQARDYGKLLSIDANYAEVCGSCFD
jgi:hypothetical protein